MQGRAEIIAFALACVACGGAGDEPDAIDTQASTSGPAMEPSSSGAPDPGTTTGPTPTSDDSTGQPPPSVDPSPIAPELGRLGTTPVDCTGAWTLPDALTGRDGLPAVGWTVADVRLDAAWANDTRFGSAWIDDPSGRHPSLRRDPLLVPEAGVCARERIAAGASPSAIVRSATAFARPASPYDALIEIAYTPPGYALAHDGALVGAIRGAIEAGNAIEGAPVVDWTAELEDELLAATSEYPVELQAALADLVLAIGEAHALKLLALQRHPLADWEAIFDAFLAESYQQHLLAFWSPAGGTFTLDVIDRGADFDASYLQAAAIRVTSAAETVAAVAAELGPLRALPIDVATPFGRIVIDPSDSDDDRSADDLAATAIVVDFGGDDSYAGQYAATVAFWSAASVLVDVSGRDVYGSDAPDIASADTPAADVFDKSRGFTQGLGLFGVGVLLDGSGDDSYGATVYGQGAGAFGIGVLADGGGTDDYRLTHFGQGAGFFGQGLLVDAEGDDAYGLYTTGQGAGKPAGQGLLVDRDGHDDYVCFYREDDPWLPAPGYPDPFAMPSDWPYAADGVAHLMSQCQGVGWGYRGDWFIPGVNWGGGFGALLDFGDGDDLHLADTFAMGMGFVYGFGYLFDGGGDDQYRTFWWGPAASAHMGVGLLEESDGDDDFAVTRLSGGYGYDYGVGWMIDDGGSDTYHGQMNYGRGYTSGMSFWITNGGDDVYNASDPDIAQPDPGFGYVDTALAGTPFIGVFIDEGAGVDVYNTAHVDVVNDAVWYAPPVGPGADPEFHKGIGIDR